MLIPEPMVEKWANQPITSSTFSFDNRKQVMSIEARH
jgi:hypothetical protein